jgi:tripartite-type tricarboxylate transporter receptor subunit TctC
MPIQLRRRHLASLFTLTALNRARDASAQEAWPIRPLRLITPYIPGSAPDVSARQLTEPLGAALGQPVVVENRPGAGGNIGNVYAARAAPDGYTLLMGTNAMVILPALQRRPVGYDPVRDFVPVAITMGMPHVLVVPNNGPADVAALIASLKARPDQSYASGGNGSGAHLVAEMFKIRTGAPAQHVPFRGAPDIVNAVMTGQVAFGFPTLATATELVRGGRLRALAVSSAQPNHALPEVPAVSRTVPGLEMMSWFGIFAPADTPAPVVTRLGDALRAAMREPVFRNRVSADGTVALDMPAAELRPFIEREAQLWGEAVRASGAQVD